MDGGRIKTTMRIGQIAYQHRWFWAVFSLGIFLRLWALLHTALLNPDGALYIYQAKMILAGHWHNLTACGLSFISIYPFLIAGFHAILDDYILSAKLVSMIFSSAALIPLYLLCRRFFEPHIAALATLIAVMNPEMCSRSGNALRDPVYWFFLALGMYFAVRYWDQRSCYRNLTMASIAFIVAVWARIDAIFPLVFTAACLPFLGGKGLLKRLLAYGAPILALCLAVLIPVILYHIPVNRFLRLDFILLKLTTAFSGYQEVASGITSLSNNQIPLIMQFFLPEVKNHIWLIALGTMINRTLETFFYPFLPFFLIGIFSIRHAVQQDARWRYLVLSIGLGYCFLYFYLLSVWVMEYRFLMLVFIPALPIAAAGLSRVAEMVESRYHLKRTTVLIVIAALLLASGLPKNLQYRDPDKIVFRHVAARIAEAKGDQNPAAVSTSEHTHRVISLYANIDLPDPPCPEPDRSGLWSRYADDMDQLILDLKKRRIGFFLYEERYWPAQEFTPERSSARKHLELIGQWHHRDTGQMKLYKVN